MIVQKSTLVVERPVLDLTGPDGNAHVLIGIAKRWFFTINSLPDEDDVVSKKMCDMGYPPPAKKLAEKWKDLESEMRSGDYENLVKVFDREFGNYCTLLR